MKKVIKNICMFVLVFVLGVAATVTYIDIFVLEDLTNDIGKLYLEGVKEGYVTAVIDRSNDNTDGWEEIAHNEAYEFIENWEYKYIK